jgi:hypothetical protein
MFSSRHTVNQNKGFSQLTEEEQIVAHLLKSEFEVHGIHLPDEQRKRVVNLQSQITQLAYEFATSTRATRGNNNKTQGIELTLEDLYGVPNDILRKLPRYSLPLFERARGISFCHKQEVKQWEHSKWRPEDGWRHKSSNMQRTPLFDSAFA